MKNLPRWAGAIALALLTTPALAQTVGSSVQFPAGWAPSQSVCVQQVDKTCVPVSAVNPLPVTGGTGGSGGPVDTVIKSTATDRSAIVGPTAATLIPANAARRGFSIQIQSAAATCYLNGTATATADYHSLQVGPGGFYETRTDQVGTGAISVICSAASTPVYAREW